MEKILAQSVDKKFTFSESSRWKDQNVSACWALLVEHFPVA